MNSSLLDLWSLSILRVAICIGSSIGVLCNPRDGSQRVDKSKIAITLTTGTMVVLTIIKLLMRSELPNWYKDAWCWSLMTWTVFASILFYCCWVLLANVKPKATSIVHVNSININAVEGDQECLVGSTSSSVGDDDDDIDGDDKSDAKNGEDKKKKGSRRTILRLLSYSKPDLPYILVGFLGLLVSSASKLNIDESF